MKLNSNSSSKNVKLNGKNKFVIIITVSLLLATLSYSANSLFFRNLTETISEKVKNRFLGAESLSVYHFSDFPQYASMAFKGLLSSYDIPHINMRMKQDSLLQSFPFKLLL